MRVIANDRMYDVRWKRIRQAANGMIIKKREEAVAVSVLTDCSISEVDETKVGAEKYSNAVVKTAELGKKDVDNRKVGRKIALAKALQVLFPTNKKIRAEFWRTYKKSCNL